MRKPCDCGKEKHSIDPWENCPTMRIIHHYKGFSIQRGITESDFCIGKKGHPLDCQYFKTLWECKLAIDESEEGYKNA